MKKEYNNKKKEKIYVGDNEMTWKNKWYNRIFSFIDRIYSNRISSKHV